MKPKQPAPPCAKCGSDKEVETVCPECPQESNSYCLRCTYFFFNDEEDTLTVKCPQGHLIAVDRIH